jgi:hypothetical protein
MNLSDLRSEVRDLIGYGAYDRLFSPAMTNDAINFACSQVAELLGLTRTDAMLAAAGNKVDMPADTARVIAVQVGTIVTDWPGPFLATWTVPDQDGFIHFPETWQVNISPLNGPGPVNFAWTMVGSQGGDAVFAPVDGQEAILQSVDLAPGEYLDVTCTVIVPGQAPQVLSKSVQFVGV